MLYGDFIDLTQEDTPRVPAPRDAAHEPEDLLLG